MWLIAGMKLFYTGPAVNADLLVMMLEKHGIAAAQEPVSPPAEGEDPEDLNRLFNVLVPVAEYDRAHGLFYADRQDEL